jgi:hypothetical protein
MPAKYQRKSKIVFRIETEARRGQYTTTHLRIQTMDEVKVSERIYWSCVDPDYYGEPEKYQRLAARGSEVFYQMDFNSREVYLSYLHYEGNDYCAPRAQTEGSLSTMQWAAKLLVKISREVAKSQGRYHGPKENYESFLKNPANVVAAMQRLGAVEIEYTPGAIGMSEAVPRFTTPHTFLTDEAAA